jgi:major membrane immunogen (membrane-anchored lipoprotein)
MKKISILFLALSFAVTSCSSSDNSSDVPQFAMTAKINGSTFEANNPFGTNLFSDSNIWSYYPIEDYVMLQGRAGGTFGNPEINLWLKRSQIAVGTYTLAPETFDEKTKSGTIVITEVNSSSKIVKGTFQFTSTDGDQNDPASIVNANVTEGTFRYKYEN